MSKRIELSNQTEINAHQKEQRAKVVAMYKNVEAEKVANLITKAEFDEHYPTETWERYSLQAVHKFREDIEKAEGIEDKEDSFKKATADLKPFVITEGDNKAIVFVRKKEDFEKVK